MTSREFVSVEVVAEPDMPDPSTAEPSTPVSPSATPQAKYGGRGENEERMVRFGYYLGLAANLIEDGPKVQMLVDSDYLDPRDVLREASAWCYGPGRAAAEAEL